MNAWIGIALYLVLWAINYRRTTKTEARNKDLQKDVIDLRERINEIEDYPMFKMWKDQHSKRA